MLDNESTLFRPGDDRVASLFLWHFVEEVEHRSSALLIYDAVVGDSWYRIRVLPAVVKHLLQVMAVIAEGVNAHVPLADRGVDARTLLPGYGARQNLQRKLRRDRSVPPPLRGSAAKADPGRGGPGVAEPDAISQSRARTAATIRRPVVPALGPRRRCHPLVHGLGSRLTRGTASGGFAVSQCNVTFDEIAARLGGFTCTDAPGFVHIRNPLMLSNWTLPVLELMMVSGAVLALWWAVRRLRRDGDPTNLVLWFASIVYLLVTEIPLYFPNIFMVEDQIGVVFDHNVFTVQFMYERLPLYIVALYPAVTTLAFEIVRAVGIFRPPGIRSIVIGSVCVGFVHQCFYEVFDQLGPQLRWWAWNGQNPLNHPMFASVPMTSLVIFATLGPAVLTLLVMLLVGRKVEDGARLSGAGLVCRTVVAGLLVPVGVAILSIPSSIFGGSHPNTTAQAVVFVIELAAFALIAVPALLKAGSSTDVAHRQTSSSRSSDRSTWRCSEYSG